MIHLMSEIHLRTQNQLYWATTLAKLGNRPPGYTEDDLALFFLGIPHERLECRFKTWRDRVGRHANLPNPRQRTFSAEVLAKVRDLVVQATLETAAKRCLETIDRFSNRILEPESTMWDTIAKRCVLQLGREHGFPSIHATTRGDNDLGGLSLRLRVLPGADFGSFRLDAPVGWESHILLRGDSYLGGCG